jgi:hypothetical protein
MSKCVFVLDAVYVKIQKLQKNVTKCCPFFLPKNRGKIAKNSK